MYPRRPVTPTRSTKSAAATSPRSPGKSKRSAKALGHGQFPGAGECFPTRRTSSNPIVPAICETRMIEKLKERGRKGMNIEMLFNASLAAAERINSSLTRENYEQVLQNGPFRVQIDRVFYSAPPDPSGDGKSHHATPAHSSRRPAPYPSVSSRSGTFRPTSVTRTGPSSSSYPPEPMDLPVRSYNSRPSTPAAGILKSSPFLSPGSRTASSIRSKLPNPIVSALTAYLTESPCGSRPREDVINHILKMGFWTRQNVEEALRQGPFAISRDTVRYEPEY